MTSQARAILLGSLLLTATSGLARGQNAAIGTIKSLHGHCTVTHGQLTYAASLGAPIYEGDTLITLWDGGIGVTFKDDTRISMGAFSRVTIPRFVFDPAGEHYGFVLRLVFGTMQYISGLTAKLSPESMKVETPTATVGVRGTRFLARAKP
jgi:hypothetical protein